MKALKSLEPKQQRTFRDKYLAVILAVAALLISSVSIAQLDSAKYTPINGYGFKYKRMAFDSVLMLPRSTSPHVPWRAGAIRYNAPDSTLQLWTGNQWNSILTGIGNGIDTAYMINDTVLAIETPDQDYMLIMPGRPRVDSIYRKAGQDSIFYLKNGVEYAIKDSIGGSGTSILLNNVGTGLRRVTTPNGSIKSDIYGYGVNGDSTTTANTITVQVDTTESNHVVTTSQLKDTAAAIRAAGGGGGGGSPSGPAGGDLTGTYPNPTIATNAVTTTKIADNNVTNAKITAFKTYPAEGTIGTIFEKSKWTAADMATEFINVGGTSIELNGNYPRSISSTAAWTTYHRILPYRPTLLPKWGYEIDFVIVSALASNIGGGPAIRSTNAFGADNGFATYLACFSSTGTPHLAKQNGDVDQTNGSFTVAQGDLIRMTLEFKDSLLTLTSQNLTTSSSIITVTKSLTAGVTPFVPNSATLGFQNFGGTYEIRRIKFWSDATRNPTLAVAADSKGQIVTSKFASRFPNQLNATYPTTLQYSGGGDQLSDFIAKKEEVMQINPEQWWILLGSNDLRYGSSLATTMERVREIKRWFDGTSTRVYWSVIPEDSTAGGIGLSAFKQALSAETGSNYIDLWTSMSTSNKLNSGYNSGDGVHPNQAANDHITSTAISSGVFTTISTQRRSPYNKFGGGIQPVGDSLGMIYKLERAANNIPRWNDSLDLVPSMITNDATKVIVSPNITKANHILSALFTVDGLTALTGASATFVLGDQSNFSNYHAWYSNAGILRFNSNGTDHTYMNASGNWKLGSVDGTTTRSIFQIRKSYTAPLTIPYVGTGMAIDSATITLGNSTYSTIPYVSILPVTYAATSGVSIDDAPTLYVGGHPQAGANTIITRGWSLWVAGKTKLETIDSTSSPVNMLYQAANGEIMKAAVPSGGSLTWEQALTNGANFSTAHTSALAGNAWTITGTQSSAAAVNINNTGNGEALGVTTTGSGSALSTNNSSTGPGASFSSNSGFGVNVTSTSGTLFRGIVNPSSTNTEIVTFRPIRQTSGTAAAGMGQIWSADLEDDAGNNISAVQHKVIWTSAAGGSTSADYQLWSYNAGTLAKKFTIKPSGQINALGYGSGTHTGTAAYSLQVDASDNVISGPLVASGTYTPTLTSEVNLTSSSISDCQYMRIGNVVTVSGKLTLDYAASGNVSVNISLPVASSVGNDYEIAGAANTNNGAGGVIRGDATNDRAQFFITSASSGGDTFFFTFTYQIL